MDFGDGVTVNLCRAVDSRNGDNGPKLTIPNSSGLQLDVHSNNDDARPTSNVQVTLLHPQSREMLAEMQSSIQSLGDNCNSTGDIVILDSNDCKRRMQSTFEDKENIPDNETLISVKKNTDGAVFSTSLIEPIGPILKSAMESKFEPDIIKAPKKQQSPVKTTNFQHRESISCGIDESTELLLVNLSGCDEKYFGNGRGYSGTDSDIEVLTSEEIVDSDWSTGNMATNELGLTPFQNIGAVIAEHPPEICPQNQNLSKNINELTDQEISVENSSCGSLSNSEQTGKDQLLKVIGEQTTYIQSLESTIARYRESYKILLEHVDALRLALDVKNIEDGNVKLEAYGIDKTPGSRDANNQN